MSKEVMFADVEISIHQADPVLGSKTLLPGQYVPLTDLPDYQQEAVRAGKVSGVRLLTQEKAEALAEHAAFLRGELPEPDLGEEETPSVSVDTDEVEEVSEDEVEPNEVTAPVTKTK